MLQSEFYERTKINLTGEEYREVEHIYDSIQMDKNEFCQLWLKNRNNKIIDELMDTIKKLEDDCTALKGTNESLAAEVDGLKAQHEGELQQMSDTHKAHMEDFARRIIKAGEYDFPSDIYDVVEEEFGIKFIARVKLQFDIELNRDEREYIINKLK